MTSARRSRRRLRNQARAPSCAGASTALGPPLPDGKRCIPPPWRALGSPVERPCLLYTSDAADDM
eukprot:8167328-Alexandrium_andersonii.AAC.1